MRALRQGQKRPPSTETQRTMQRLWAQVLDIEPESIGVDDSFFRLRGDSIAAMKLVGEAGKVGIRLTVADTFRQPKLVDLSGLDSYPSPMDEEIPAFALLGNDTDVARVRNEVAISCYVDTSLVEDIYPCSPLQEGLISLTSKRAGDYIMQSVLQLRDNIDEHTLRAAWGRVVQSTTRAAHSDCPQQQGRFATSRYSREYSVGRGRRIRGSILRKTSRSPWDWVTR